MDRFTIAYNVLHSRRYCRKRLLQTEFSRVMNSTAAFTSEKIVQQLNLLFMEGNILDLIAR